MMAGENKFSPDHSDSVGVMIVGMQNEWNFTSPTELLIQLIWMASCV